MEDAVVIGLTPERLNIKIIVKPCSDMMVLCESLSKDLLENHTKAIKTVIFCRLLNDCGKMCRNCLEKYITEPPGLPDNFLQFQLIDVFTAASDNDMREEIITKSDTKLRQIIASTAFGLGIDCKDIARVINYGTPTTLEELVQEEMVTKLKPFCTTRLSETKLVCRQTNTEKTKVFATENYFLRIFLF